MDKFDYHTEVKERPDQRATQAYILYAVSFLLMVTIGTVLQLRSVRFGLAFTELALILAPAILFVYRKKLPMAEALRWRPVPINITLQSIAVGISSWGVAAGIVSLTIPILGVPPSIPTLEPQTSFDLLLILLTAALLPGLCEEILFRGVLQGILSRKGQRTGVVITALLFAAFHLNPWIFFPAFFLGVVFGILVIRTGSLIPAILAHIATNATAFTVAYIFQDQPDSEIYPWLLGLAIAFCAIFPFLWLSTRGSSTGVPLLATVPARVERRGFWLIWMMGGMIATIILAIVTAAFLLIEVRNMPDDSLAPEIRKGDQLVIFKKGMTMELDLETGDIISYRKDGNIALQEVVRIDDETVWIRDGDADLTLSREEILGKMVYMKSTSESSIEN